jgi:hypothetical protein
VLQLLQTEGIVKQPSLVLTSSMARRKYTDKDREDQARKNRWRAYQGTTRRSIEHIIFDRSERTRLDQSECIDRSVRRYQPNKSIRSEPGAYTNSWVIPPTELVADDWDFAVTSGEQTTIVKVKYRPSGQIFVQA